MNVLSLFDGLSCCYLALNDAGIEVSNYYASEIDKYASQVSEHHFPNAVRLGDVTLWEEWSIDWGRIDLVTAGFPCQAWSMAGQQLGDKDPRGALFWTTLEIIKNVLDHNPNAKFMMENVKMKREFEEYITHHTEQALGYVEKTLINSALVSAQNRNRYYWTNFPVSQPKDEGIVLRDIVEHGDVDRDKSLAVTTRIAGATKKRYLEKSQHQMVIVQKPRGFNKGGVFTEKSPTLTSSSWQHNNHLVKSAAIRGRYDKDGKINQQLEVRKDEKSNTLTTVQKDNVLVRVGTAADIKGHDGLKRIYSVTGKCPTQTTMQGGHRQPKIATDELHYRKLTPLECERLQTIPDNFTLIQDQNGKQLVSNSQRYKMIGNGWTVKVISHIFKEMMK